jgi:hypothetical protein
MMKNYRYISIFLLFVAASCAFISCKKEEPFSPVVTKYGKLTFKFYHQVNGMPMIVDTMEYVNAAGNPYNISEVQWFLSDVVLHNGDGSIKMITQNNGIHYIDSDIPSSQTWSITQDIPAGTYESISFVFGIKSDRNLSNMFLNPPETNMFWPELLGGGYHYLKLNGSWKDTSNVSRFYNFHMGKGQIYASNVIVYDSITGYVDNSFTVTVPASSFTLDENQNKEIGIVMNIESWFATPHVWDFNFWGGAIMQNQPAMNTAKENGADVFTMKL